MHEANGHKFRMCFFKESFNWSNHRIIWFFAKTTHRKLWPTNICLLIRNFESNQHFVLIVPILFGESGSKDFNVIIVNSLFIRKVFKLTNSQSQSHFETSIWKPILAMSRICLFPMLKNVTSKDTRSWTPADTFVQRKS